MEAEEEGGKVGWEERAEEVGEGVVVCCGHGERGCYAVVPIPVGAGKGDGMVPVVQNVAVKHVCEDFAEEVPFA